MKDKELKELLKEQTPHRVLSRYANGLISLNRKQLNMLLKMSK